MEGLGAGSWEMFGDETYPRYWHTFQGSSFLIKKFKKDYEWSQTIGSTNIIATGMNTDSNMPEHVG